MKKHLPSILLKKILQNGSMSYPSHKPVSKKFMKEWEEMVDGLIYDERLPEWRQIGSGVWSKLMDKYEIEVAVYLMKALDQKENYKDLKQTLEALKKTKDCDVAKTLNVVLNFSKQGPQFYCYIKNIKDPLLNSDVRRISNENLAFERNLQLRNLNSQPSKDQ